METADLKIFLVDDDPFCLELYEQHLFNLGYKHIVKFENGQDCVNRLTEQPDIIFLDYSMKPLNGLEVLKKIKRFNPDIYLIIISSQEDMQVAINSLKYGAFDYIIKRDDDLTMITKVLEKMRGVMVLMEESKPKKWSRIFSILNF